MVGAVAVRAVGLEVRWELDDVHGVARALRREGTEGREEKRKRGREVRGER